MKTVHVSASRSYDITIGRGALALAGEITARLRPLSTVVIISDDNVAPLYLKAVESSFSKAGFAVKSYVFPHSEQSKNLSVLSDILEFLARERITRTDMLAALGGGITGDITGFAASVYLRGIDFVQLPTSLLAAADSSVGGKTAVNLSAGKNLAGSFYQPSAVICDTDCFATLKPEFISDGMAEIIKYGMICSEKLLDILEKRSADESYDEIIAQCVEIKSSIVSRDEFDRGERQLLNFGHTIGHAVEKLSGFTVMHGHAVASGMAYMSHLALENGFCREDFTQRLSLLLGRFALPSSCEYTADALFSAACGDKKCGGNSITLVIPEKWGHCALKTVTLGEFARMLGAKPF